MKVPLIGALFLIASKAALADPVPVVTEYDFFGYHNGIRVSLVEDAKETLLVDVRMPIDMSLVAHYAQNARDAIAKVKTSGEKLHIDTDLLRCISSFKTNSRGESIRDYNRGHCDHDLFSLAFYAEKEKEYPPALWLEIAWQRHALRAHLQMIFGGFYEWDDVTRNYVDRKAILKKFPFYADKPMFWTPNRKKRL